MRFVLCYSCPSLAVPNDMISRRRILSRSRDDLNLDTGVGFPVQVEEEEDVWYNKDKLYKVRLLYFIRLGITCMCVYINDFKPHK